MISSNEMKKGLTLDVEGEPYTVLEWQHVGEARCSANIRMKLRHLRTGTIIERPRAVGPSSGVVMVERRGVTFKYGNGEFAPFVEPDPKNKTMTPAELRGAAGKYIVNTQKPAFLRLKEARVGEGLPAE